MRGGGWGGLELGCLGFGFGFELSVKAQGRTEKELKASPLAGLPQKMFI